jgi:hypothetical protein
MIFMVSAERAAFVILRRVQLDMRFERAADMVKLLVYPYAVAVMLLSDSVAREQPADRGYLSGGATLARTGDTPYQLNSHASN